MKISVISALAGVTVSVAIAACSERGSDAEPAYAPPRESSRTAAENRVPDAKPIQPAPVDPAELPPQTSADADKPTDSVTEGVRDAKAATEDVVRKIVDVTRDAAAAITEAGREAVQSVREGGDKDGKK